MPIELLRNGFTGRITYSGQSVNLFGEKFSNVVSENVNPQNVRKSSRNLEAQNQKLKEDVAYLKKLVKIQKQGNKDFTLDREWVKRKAQTTLNQLWQEAASDRRRNVKAEKREKRNRLGDVTKMLNRYLLRPKSFEIKKHT